MPDDQRSGEEGTVEGDRYPGAAVRVAAAYSWRLLVIGAAVYVVLRLLGHVLTLVIPFTLALLVTALLRPLMLAMRNRGVPRSLATLLSVLTAFIVIAGILALVITKAVGQAPQLADEVNRLIPRVEHWLITGPLQLDRSSITNLSTKLSNEVDKNSASIASAALSTGKAAVDVLTGILIAIFVTIFLVYDGEGIWAFLVRGFPRAARVQVDAAGQAAWKTLGHYVRGTLIVALFHGTAIAVVLAVLGVPLIIPLALIVALGSFVPIVGSVVTGAFAVAVAGISRGLVAAIIVAAVLVLDNQIEAHLLQPFVVGRYVHLHPLAIVVALTAGALLLGIYGAVIAVPLTACINSAVRALIHDPEPEDPVDPEPDDPVGPPVATSG